MHNGILFSPGQNSEQHLPELSPPIPFQSAKNILEINSNTHFQDIPSMIVP
jgi:hypothetical protein